ncbi:hypothetical protein SPURM210S_05740 [Streptomyces purpurascens]|nr:hypothetical protein GCM10010303_42300 [Streptomyces purpurascens]
MEAREPRHPQEQDHPDPARPRLPPLHRHPARRHTRHDGPRGRVRRQHPLRQRRARRLPVLPGDRKVGDLYLGGKLTFNKVVVDRPGTYQVKVAYVSGDARPVEISANGGEATRHTFPSTGDWGTVETVSVPVTLKAGASTITFDSGSGHAPDIDRIDVPKPS